MGLTEKRIRDAKPGQRTRIEWDADAKGLGLRITPAGVKAFVFDYRADGVRRRMTLGRVGALSLADVVAGCDPGAIPNRHLSTKSSSASRRRRTPSSGARWEPLSLVR